MAISNVTPRVLYTGDNATTKFAVTFELPANLTAGNTITDNKSNITSGTKILTTGTSNIFYDSTNLVGKSIVIVGAGTGGSNLSATINTVTNSEAIVINTDAITSVTNASIVVTTGDTGTTIRNNSDLRVSVDGTQKSIGSDYNVELNIGDSTSKKGNVIFATAPTTDAIVTIVRDVVVERLTDFQTGGALTAPSLNKEFDQMLMAVQDNQVDTDLSLKFAADDSVVVANTVIPNTTTRANKALTFDANGTPNVSGDFTAGTITGNLIGNISGATTITGTTFTGNVVGNVTGDLTGNVTGNIAGDITGDITGNVTGNISATTIDVSGASNLQGNVRLGTYYYPMTGGSNNAVLILNTASDSFEFSTGTGTVTSIDTGTGLTGGPIATTGTISLDATLNDLNDVDTTGAVQDRVLSYDATASKWTVGIPITTLDGLSDVGVVGAANGQVLEYNSSANEWQAKAPVRTVNNLTDVNVSHMFGYDPVSMTIVDDTANTQFLESGFNANVTSGSYDGPPLVAWNNDAGEFQLTKHISVDAQQRPTMTKSLQFIDSINVFTYGSNIGIGWGGDYENNVANADGYIIYNGDGNDDRISQKSNNASLTTATDYNVNVAQYNLTAGNTELDTGNLIFYDASATVNTDYYAGSISSSVLYKRRLYDTRFPNQWNFGGITLGGNRGLHFTSSNTSNTEPEENRIGSALSTFSPAKISVGTAGMSSSSGGDTVIDFDRNKLNVQATSGIFANTYTVKGNVSGTSTSTGKIVFMDADDTHQLTLSAPDSISANVDFKLPSADGTSGQVLTTHANGQLYFSTVSGGGGGGGGGSMNDLVDDTTPQLGGDLEVNGFAINAQGSNHITLNSDNDVRIWGHDDVQVWGYDKAEYLGGNIQILQDSGNSSQKEGINICANEGNVVIRSKSSNTKHRVKIQSKHDIQIQAEDDISIEAKDDWMIKMFRTNITSNTYTGNIVGGTNSKIIVSTVNANDQTLADAGSGQVDITYANGTVAATNIFVGGANATSFSLDETADDLGLVADNGASIFFHFDTYEKQGKLDDKKFTMIEEGGYAGGRDRQFVLSSDYYGDYNDGAWNDYDDDVHRVPTQFSLGIKGYKGSLFLNAHQTYASYPSGSPTEVDKQIFEVRNRDNSTASWVSERIADQMKMFVPIRMYNDTTTNLNSNLGSDGEIAYDTTTNKFVGRVNGSTVDFATGSDITADSIGESGYIKFSNGLILQWGLWGTFGGTVSTGSVTFPIAFPNNRFTVTTGLWNGNSTGLDSLVLNSTVSKTGFTWYQNDTAQSGRLGAYMATGN